MQKVACDFVPTNCTYSQTSPSHSFFYMTFLHNKYMQLFPILDQALYPSFLIMQVKDTLNDNMI